VRAAIGADLGGTKIAVGVVDTDRNILHRDTEPTTGLSLEGLMETLERELREALEACPDAVAIGLGFPATIDHERGVAVQAVNLPVENFPAREYLEERFGLPVSVDNDANLAALAEHHYGAGRGPRNMVLLTIGTGIGGGLVLEGRLYRGTTGAGAELGHMVINELDGRKCQGNCPNHGCVEAYASGTALGRAGREAAERHPESALGRALAAGEEITGRAVTAAAIAGDEAAIAALTEVGGHLGVALASYANIFEPDLSVIGGGVIAAGELLLEPAREQVRSRALPPMNETPVVAAALGPDAGMIGAATMALGETG
jgi:glucokinase